MLTEDFLLLVQYVRLFFAICKKKMRKKGVFVVVMEKILQST